MSTVPYNVKTVKKLVKEMESLMATQPHFSKEQANFIINNLIQGLRMAVTRIESLNSELDAQERLFMSRVGGSSHDSN